MKRTLVSLLSLLAIALVTLASCSEPDNAPGNAASVSVRVVDAMNAKTISPTGNVDVSHYKIYIQNEAENITYVSTGAASDYLEKEDAYTVTNVPAGMWKAKVEAYVKNENSSDGYILVATAESDETRVNAGDSATITVTLDKLNDELSGDVTIDLVMPAELDDEGDSFYYTYTISGTGQRSKYSYEMDTPVMGLTGVNGNGRIVIDADTLDPMLSQGAYLITLTIFDKATEAESDIVRKGVEIMRLLPGLAASGEINLHSQIIDEDGFQVAVIDKIGDKLDLGSASFNEGGFDIDFTITLAYNGIATDTPVDVYIDGYKKSAGSDYSTTPGADNVAFRFLSFASGRHVVTFILDEADTQLGVGSLTVEVNVPADIEISPVV